MIGRIGRPGLLGMAARTAVVAGTATAVTGRMQRRQQQKYAQQDEAQAQQAYAQQAAAQQATAQQAGGEPDYMEEIQRLAQLKSQGIITEEEFDAKKKQLLGI